MNPLFIFIPIKTKEADGYSEITQLLSQKANAKIELQNRFYKM